MILTLTNIGSLGPGEVVFDFTPGINAIVGVNGSGKSTCVNALYFALTGETINNDTFDDLITWGCVSGKVELDCGSFKIVRSLKLEGSAKSSLTIGGKTITRKKEIDSVICELFGFVDLSVFRLVFFAEQYRAVDLIDGTDSQRIAMLSSLFGFARLEKIRATLLQYANTLDTSVVSPDVMSSIDNALKSAEADLAFQVSEYSRLSALLLDDTRIGELNVKATAPLLGTKDELRKVILQETEQLLMHQEKLDAIPKPPSAEEGAIYQRYTQRERDKAQLAEKQAELDGLIASRGLAPGAIQGFLSQLETSRNSVIIKKQRLAERSNLVQTGKCPLTGGVPCPDLLAITDQTIIATQTAELDTQLDEMDRDRADMQTALSDAQRLEAAIDAASGVVDSLKRQIDSAAIPDNYNPEDYLSACDGVNTEEIKRLTSAIATMQAHINSVKTELDKYGEVIECSQEDREAAMSALMQHNTAKNQLDVVANNIALAEARVAEQKQSKEFAVIQNDTAEINIGKKNMLNLVRGAFHKDSLPRLLLSDILEQLNVLMDQELSEFAFPYTVKWLSNGALVYSEAGEEDHPVRKLSGGQKYVLVLAMRCAFKRLLNTQFPFFVLDEPTTGLDVQNREYLSQSLNKLRDRYPDLVMVIPTHDQMLLPESNVISL